MNILVTGANGQLGTEMRQMAVGSGYNWVFSDVTELPGVETVGLDITDEDAVKTMVSAEKIDVIVNCAAYTNVDRAEGDWACADLLNNTAAGNLAAAAASDGALLIHISTDYVFGGDSSKPYMEENPVKPCGVYGATKLSGERSVVKSGCRYVILRTSWLYSPYGNNFVKTMRRLTSQADSIKVVSDQVGTPTYAADLASAVMTVIGRSGDSIEGIYHFSNEGACTWYDFAKEICSLSGNVCDIVPCKTCEYPTKAVRPHYSVLDKSKFKSVFGVRIPYWRDSLCRCVEILQGDNS